MVYADSRQNAKTVCITAGMTGYRRSTAACQSCLESVSRGARGARPFGIIARNLFEVVSAHQDRCLGVFISHFVTATVIYVELDVVRNFREVKYMKNASRRAGAISASSTPKSRPDACPEHVLRVRV